MPMVEERSSREGYWSFNQRPAPLARRHRFLLLLICTLFIASIGLNLRRPFREWEAEGGFNGIFARNYMRLGYLNVRLGQVPIARPDPQNSPELGNYYYARRPPLPAILLSVWFHVLGESEWVYRLSLGLVSLASILAFFGIARRLLDDRHAVLATAFFALNPMVLFYGTTVTHYAYALLWSLLAWYAALRPGVTFRVLSMACAALACLTDWPSYCAIVALMILLWKRGERRQVALLAGTCLSGLAIHLLHLWSLEPEYGFYLKDLLSTAIERSGGVGVASFALFMARDLILLYTAGACVLSIAGAVVLLRRRCFPVLLLALFGLEPLVFWGEAARCSYLTLFLAPTIALSAAVGALAMSQRARIMYVAWTLCVLSVAQALAVYGVRETAASSEVSFRTARFVREATSPQDGVLLIFPATRLVAFYAEREIQLRYFGSVSSLGRDVGKSLDDLMLELQRDLWKYDVVVTGAAEADADRIRELGLTTESVGFLGPEHPIRRLLHRVAAEERIVGPFAVYRLEHVRKLSSTLPIIDTCHALQRLEARFAPALNFPPH